ncbi:MAG: preprotein translocase subunit SecE [Candidatus Marinimicrobia bacterium]|nr:preprotein translocase subunit SecE [Candidatus Neomarinimicrobiota bacterium]
MNKIAAAVTGMRTFWGEVRTELVKCVWPTRSELVDSTIVVAIAVVALGAYIGVSDTLIMGLLRILIR